MITMTVNIRKFQRELREAAEAARKEALRAGNQAILNKAGLSKVKITITRIGE